MFGVVPPPIIRRANNCIYSIWYLSHRYCYLPLSWKSWNWFECAVGGVRQPQHTQTFALLGSYGVWVESWLRTFRDHLSVPSSSVNQSKNTAWTLKMGPIGNPETSATSYKPKPHNIPEQRSRLHSGQRSPKLSL